MALFSDRDVWKRFCPSMYGVDRLFDYFTAEGASHVGMIRYEKAVIAATALASAAVVTIFTPAAGESWALRDLKIGPGALTNFAAGGDRLLDIKSDTNIFSRIPNASLETLVAAAWGATALPFPATPAHGDALITAAAPLVAAHQGGSADHASGSITILAVLQRTA